MDTTTQIVIALVITCIILIIWIYNKSTLCAKLERKNKELTDKITKLHSKRFTLDVPAPEQPQLDNVEDLKKEVEDLRKKNYDLKQQIAVENDWKAKYNELHKIYYKLYTEYQNNPSATATDLFPIDDDALSIIKLKTDLNYAEDTIAELHCQISHHKGKLIEADNEIKALKYQLKESDSDYIELNKSYSNLKEKYEILIEEKSDYFDLLEAHEKILKSFRKNSHLFYDDSKQIKTFYSKMDKNRLYRAFDPTLCFKKITYEIAHSDKPNENSHETTLTSCTCDDFTINTKGRQPCKHMIFLAYNLGNLFINKEATEKYFKEDIKFLEYKHALESDIKQLKKDKRDLKEEIKILKKEKTALSDG